MKKIFASVFFAALFISFANAENNFFCNNFSKTFINALISEKVSDLDDLMPTEDFLRKNFPAEADKLKEGEELQKAIKEKIKQDFQLIIQSKKKFNIDPTKFENIACKLESPYGEDSPLKALSVHYDYDGHSGEFAFGLIEFDGDYYLQGILLSHDVFNFEN